MSSRRVGHLGVGIAIVALAWIAVSTLGDSSLSSHGPHVAGASAGYQYELEDDDGDLQLWIDIPQGDHLETGDDFAAYKASNDARSNAWVASPSSAPATENKQLSVTFVEPMTPAEVAAVLSATSFEVNQYMVVGERASGEASVSVYYGPVDSAKVNDLMAAPQLSMACEKEPTSPACYTTTYTGIMAVGGVATAAGITALDYLKNHPDVYLADSTGIQVLEDIGSGLSSDPSVNLPTALFAVDTVSAWP